MVCIQTYPKISTIASLPREGDVPRGRTKRKERNKERRKRNKERRGKKKKRNELYVY